MASFVYVARETASGREIRSSVDAATEQAAIAALLNRNMLVLSIQEKVGKQGRTSGGRVALADLVIFTRQLATMIDAGLAMVQSLQALAEQTTNKVMRDVIRDVCARVESGDSFSEALQKHPKAFNRLYVCMVGAGEKGGLLAEILARLAVYLENTARLRKKVKSAMMYPTVVTVVAILITIFLLVKVVPVFGEIFSSFNATLPAPTLYLINDQQFREEVPRFRCAGCRRGGVWLVLFHQDPGGAAFLGFAPHPVADLRLHRPQDLPRPVYPHAGFADPQRRADSGGAANRFPDGGQRGHGEGGQDRRAWILSAGRAFPPPWPSIRSSPA